MLSRAYAGPLCREFRHDLGGVLALFEQYQHEVVSHAGLKVACTRGCTHCCCHWPEDVYSFEGEIAADTIVARIPDRVGRIVEMFRCDEREMVRLDAIVTARLQDKEIREQFSEEDHIDLLLASYYRLGRPCALQNPDGSCAVYDVRPLSCRIYLNFSDPRFCIPDQVDETDVRTYLLDFEEEASSLLDSLHERFVRYEGVTGLRPLLARLLEERLRQGL